MSENSAIEWTNATWNPWRGCHKVTAGCKNCYMFREQKRYGRDPNTVVRSASTFNDPLRWSRKLPPGERLLVFTCSWSDWFIADANDWRGEAWDIIRRTPNITYQILTKRAEMIRDRLPVDWGDGWPNVWLGVTVESEDYIWRAYDLAEVPARVRFISYEPAIGPANFSPVSRFINWVIVGGESGPNCRPMDIEWARAVRHDCWRDGVAFFMKQIGGHPNKRHNLADLPEDLRVREFPA